MKNSSFLLIVVLALFTSCESNTNTSLPYLGDHDLDTTVVNGKMKVDTDYFKIPDFRFLNQDSVMVSNETLDGKYYIADFFFSYCPDICIPMKSQMLRVHEKFKTVERLKLISHTLDPEHDSIPFLKQYAESLNIDTEQWMFLNGKEAEVYELAKKGYISYAQRDQSSPGGIVHSGFFILVDPDRHIRGVYDGTNEEDVDKLIEDLEREFAKN